MLDKELRYEYRIFVKNPLLIEEKISDSFDHVDIKKSFELYLVFKNFSNFTVKFRNNKLSIKKLIHLKEGFEKWKPLNEKEGYEELKLLFNEEGIKLPNMHQDSILHEAKRSKDILTVPLSKKRSLFKCDLLLEISQIKISNSFFHTVCIESNDLNLLKKRANDLGMLEYKNCNYVKKILKLC